MQKHKSDVLGILHQSLTLNLHEHLKHCGVPTILGSSPLAFARLPLPLTECLHANDLVIFGAGHSVTVTSILRIREPCRSGTDTINTRRDKTLLTCRKTLLDAEQCQHSSSHGFSDTCLFTYLTKVTSGHGE